MRAVVIEAVEQETDLALGHAQAQVLGGDEGKLLAAQTRNTLTQIAALERDLERIQRQGFATDSEEAEIGVRCVAAGIRNDAGRLIAALSLSTPADRISQRIGHQPEPAKIGAH